MGVPVERRVCGLGSAVLEHDGGVALSGMLVHVWGVVCVCMRGLVPVVHTLYRPTQRFMQFLDTSRAWSPLAYVGLFAVHWLAFLAGPMTLGRLLRGESSTVYQGLSTVPLADAQAAVGLARRASTAARELQRRSSSLLRAFSAGDLRADH